MNVHPQTGMHYVHVIPDVWGAYVDMFACYSEFSSRTPWSTVMTPDAFQSFRGEAEFKQPHIFSVLWDYEQDPGSKADRNSLAAAVYSEAIPRGDSEDGMLDSHVHVMNRFKKRVANLDAVFGHTPWMRDQLSKLFGLPAHVMPVGWNAAAMGAPRWNAPKHNELTFHGSMAGRRNVIIPYFQRTLGNKFKILDGTFGRQLTGALDNSRANLYVAHSACGSYSTWRLWQLLATSCGLISEPGDHWPFEEQHMVKIPEIGIDNIEQVCNHIYQKTMELDFQAIAKKAHDELGPEFTTDKCVERFLVPASLQMAERRSQQ